MSTPLAVPAAAVATDPGWFAFVGFFALAIVLWLLMRNMNARMRRMSYRQNAAQRGRDDPQADEVDIPEADGPSVDGPDEGPR
jgi:membrane protein implicated in regulation of membrane protease activity